MNQKQHSTKYKIGMICLLVILGSAIGSLIGILLAITQDLPQIRSLENFQPSSVTRIYSADKVLVSELFIEKRTPIGLDQIPDYLKQALVATEDRNFYKHQGIDIKGIFRAVIKDILALEFKEGASTLTQQLSKTLFLTPQKTLMRKLKEALLSFQLERRYTKDEILELYLNQVYFGSGAYGVESAAQIYFGKTAKDLDLAECALIAGLVKAPSKYSPLVNKQLSQKRRDLVLFQMKQIGLIDQAQYLHAINTPVNTVKEKKNQLLAPYFIDYIKNRLEDEIGATSLYRGGLRIYTTLDSQLQKHANESCLNGIQALTVRMKQNGVETPAPQCALVSIDVKTGGILAMVGGKNYDDSTFNRAVNANRQPGSAFKPFVFAYAIEQHFSQNKLLLDSPIIFEAGKNGQFWKPQNYSKTYKGEISMRYALAVSQNIPAIRLMEILGPVSVAHFAHLMGINSPLAANLSLALGTSEVNLLELTGAYSVFPNKGQYIKPFGVTEIINSKGQSIWRVKPEKHISMSRQGSAIMTDMLQAVVLEGTGRNARVIKRPIAGKTGTTDNCHDALFMGFSPSITTGVWVGNDDNTSLGKIETGARAALPIWIDFMEYALKNKSYSYFDLPDGVVKLKFDPISGSFNPTGSDRSVEGLFRKSDIHQQ